MTRRTHGAASAVAVALVVAALLAGCASSPDLTADAATRLQAGVLAVSNASAADDLPAARTALDALTRAVAAARKDGQISVERQKLIEASLVPVSADLATLEQKAAQVQAQAAAVTAARVAAEAAARAAASDTKGHRVKNPKGND